MSDKENIFDFLTKLRESGVSEDLVAQKARDFLQKKAREVGVPYHGHFELTPLCNLDCKMCYVHLYKDQIGDRRLLSPHEWLALIQQAIGAGMVKAALSGGECLTYPGFDEIYLFLKSKGIITSVLTNGLLLNNERISFFRAHMPHKIQISLYGSTEDAYEKVTGKRVFSSVFNNIIAAKRANLPVKISITPSRYMLEDVRNTIRLVKENDLPYAINIGLMTPRTDTGRGDGEHDISIDDYIEIIKYNRYLNNKIPVPQKVLPHNNVIGTDFENTGLKCGAGRSTFSINWLGLMNPCAQLSSITAEPLKYGFKSAWQDINKKVSTFPRFTVCDNCPYSHACSICAAENEKMGSRHFLNPKWCEMTWKMVENGIRPSEIQCDY